MAPAVTLVGTVTVTSLEMIADPQVGAEVQTRNQVPLPSTEPDGV